MAKQTSDREDLLRDGVQMPTRGQADIAGNELFIGFRRTGQLSLYWNQDPVYQFNAQQELRRLFFCGTRYAAFERRLRRLDTASEDAAQTEVTKLSLSQSDASDALLEQVSTEFIAIRKQILQAPIEWRVVGNESPATFDLRVRNWLAQVGDVLKLAAVPNV